MLTEKYTQNSKFEDDIEFYLRYQLPPVSGVELLRYIERAAMKNHCSIEDILPIIGKLLTEAKNKNMTLRQYVYDQWEPYIKSAYWDDLVETLRIYQ